jgi:hypothetical protein
MLSDVVGLTVALSSVAAERYTVTPGLVGYLSP